MQKLLGAILLIVGTSVGAGMLGLPVATGNAGFFPSLVLMLVVWVVTTVSALLLAEVVVRGSKGANFFSLSEHYFGAAGRGITLIVYFILFFSLVTAYVKGGGLFLSDYFGFSIPWKGSLIFTVLFIPFIFLGTFFVEKINAILTFFLFLFYFGLVFAGFKYVSPSFLQNHSFTESFFSLPLIVTAFSYHGTLPTIVNYLNQDLKKIRAAIFAGSGITLGIYVFWQYVMLGIIPLIGEASLSTALEADKTAMLFLEKVTGSPWVGKWGAAFSFVALTTSFLGVSIGVVDFFIDAFKLSRSVAHRCMISLSIFLPAVFLAGAKVPIFYISLKYGAGFACIFLLIFLPAAMSAKNKRLAESIFQSSRSKVIYGIYLFVALALVSTFWGLLG